MNYHQIQFLVSFLAQALFPNMPAEGQGGEALDERVGQQIPTGLRTTVIEAILERKSGTKRKISERPIFAYKKQSNVKYNLIRAKAPLQKEKYE